MRFSRARFPQCLLAMTLLSSIITVDSFPLERLAAGISLPVPDMMLGLFVATLKLSIAGRVMGLMSDWFVNDVPAGVIVRKDVVDDSTKSEHSQQAEGEPETDDDETRMEHLKKRIAQIYGTLLSNTKSENIEEGPAHRISRREAADPKNGSENQSAQIHGTSAEISLDADEVNKNIPLVRTFGRNRCVLKLVCKFEDQESGREESYPAQAARYVSDFWERFHPSFLDYLFGYEEVTLLARTDYGIGCFLHHNSCPMRIVNVVMLATSLQRVGERSAEP